MKSMENKRLFGLDVVRAIAVLMVVFYHSTSLLTPLMQLPYRIGWLFGKIIAITNMLGLLGVELFFVLSGFLIGGILIREFMAASTFSLSFVKDFWIKRWSRTLPNYYLILGLNTLLLFFYQGVVTLDVRYLLFLQNFAQPHPAFFPEAWSLSIEEWFYLTLPLILLLASIFLKSRPKQAALLFTLIIYLFVFMTMRILTAIYPAYADLGQDSSIRKVVIYRLDAIAFGVIIAYLHNFHGAFLNQQKIRKSLFIIGFCLTILILFLNFLSLHPSFNYYGKSPIIRFLSDSFLYSLLPLSLSLMLPAAVTMTRFSANTFKINSIVTHISLISYSMYLIHYSLIFLPFFEKRQPNNWLTALFFYGLYWAITISIATLIYYYYEKPTTQFLRKKRVSSSSKIKEEYVG
jgi:peptidoglycan/LPS O-acetylase OafA/YrhL